MPRLLAGFAVERTDAARVGSGTIPSLTGSTQTLVAGNPARVALYVSNPGAVNKMFLGLGANAAVNAGIMVAPGQTVGPITAFTGNVQIIGTAADTAAYCEI